MNDIDKGKEVAVFGKLLLSMFAEFKRVEASLPDGFEPDELVNTIACADGGWRVSVSRVSEAEWPGDGTCRKCGHCPRSPKTGLCASCQDELSDAAHPDNLAVDRFAAAMKEKLAEKRAEGRGGWEDRNDCPAERLSDMLRAHVVKGDPLDVGNFAMMLHQRGDGITEVEPTPLVVQLDRSLGMYGEAFDMPGPKRAYTYRHQPGNRGAYSLGIALNVANAGSSGDNIDRGLNLMKALGEQGWGVFAIERDPT